MHAVARNGPAFWLVLVLLAPVSAAGTAEVGQPAPDFSLPSIHSDYDTVRLDDLRGKVVVVDFWSSWCAPCRRAMPTLDTLRAAYPRDGLEVVGVNVDPVVDDGRRFLARAPVSYPNAADTDGDVAARFGVDVLPALFVIDRAGIVRGAASGGAAGNKERLRAKLVQLVEEGAP
ncbi:MAG: TlpA family protein disulfide reductase [Pseudomonadota bacterium]